MPRRTALEPIIQPDVPAVNRFLEQFQGIAWSTRDYPDAAFLRPGFQASRLILERTFGQDVSSLMEKGSQTIATEVRPWTRRITKRKVRRWVGRLHRAIRQDQALKEQNAPYEERQKRRGVMRVLTPVLEAVGQGEAINQIYQQLREEQGQRIVAKIKEQFPILRDKS